jgi:hypothetical protein
MAAPNKEPFGSRGGMKSPNEHAPNKAGKPASSGRAMLGQGVANHGTPKPVGNNKKNPLH